MEPKLTGTRDARFLSLFSAGEESAFDCLFRELFAPLTYFANRLLRDPVIAEDIVQDCFVLLWQRRERLDQVKAIKSYLYTMVRNQCLKYLEKQKPMEPVMHDKDTVPAVEAALIAAETAGELYRMIRRLSPALQQIIRLYYLEEKSNKEIAKLLQIEAGTVNRQRLRALLALRKTKISL